MNFIKGYHIPQVSLEERIRNLGHESVRAYQEWNGLETVGRINKETTDHLTRRRCGVPDILPIGALSKTCGWTFKTPTICPRLVLPTMKAADIIEIWELSVDRWNEASGLRMKVIDDFDAANVYSESGAIDGGGGVLAWSYLACDSDHDDRIQQLYDVRESWNFEFLLEVATHEIGHALGIPHLPVGNIMTAHAMGYTKLGPLDIDEIQARYGKPEVAPVPPTPTPPDAGSSILSGTVNGRRMIFIGLEV